MVPQTPQGRARPLADAGSPEVESLVDKGNHSQDVDVVGVRQGLLQFAQALDYFVVRITLNFSPLASTLGVLRLQT